MSKRDKQNKQDNKGSSLVKILAGITVILIVLVGLATFGQCGSGNGNGDGNNNNDAVSTSSNEFEDAEEASTDEYFNVSVSGNEYLYENSKVSLDELIDELTNISTDVSVKITDENASQKAYRELIEALEEHNIQYMEEQEK